MAYTVSDDLPITIGVNYITDANMFSGLKDKDGDSYPDAFDDFPDDSTLWNDTDGDGWPDPGHGDSILDSLIDIDADGDNIIDSDENFDDIYEDAIKNNTLEKVIPIRDREKAIIYGSKLIEDNDCLAILGKGHEETQEENGKISFFSDYEVVNEIYK